MNSPLFQRGARGVLTKYEVQSTKYESTQIDLWQNVFVCTLLICCALLSGCNIAATGHNMQGKRLFEQGQFSQALQSFNKAVQANPENADAYYNMAATYYFLGKQNRNTAWTQQAEQLYRQAINLDPGHVDTYRGLAVLMVESGRTGDAFQTIQNWRLRQPASADPMIELARLYKEHGNRPQATQLLVDALNIDSTNARALRAMGQIREEEGQYQLALNNYIRSYQANNLQPEVAARIAALQGRTQAQQTAPLQPGQPRLGEVNQYVPR